jgi:gamma-glutamylputrescine oxidase
MIESIRASEGPTHWFASANCDRLTEPCKLPSSAEVVVIGGGVMGVATTYWLSQSGLAVVALEGRRLGWGASGRNAGFMLCGTSGLQDVALIQQVLTAEGIEGEFERPGHLALTTSPKVLDAMTQELAGRPPLAQPLYVLDHRACEDVMKLRISPDFLGGRWLPGGGTIHPVKFVYGLAAAAERRGAMLAQNTRALQIEKTRRGDLLRVHTDRGRIDCRHVVIACNTKSGELAPGLSPMLTSVRGQVLSTEPLKRMFNVGLAVDWGTVYWRQTTEGVIVMGGYRGLDREAETTSSEELNPAIQAALEGFLPKAFPDLPPIQVARRWAGIMDETPDEKPIVGQWPARSQTWVVAGFGGHGLPPALGATRALASSIAKGEITTELNPLSPDRFVTVHHA